MTKVQIIDAICGAGKSSYIFNKMKWSNPDTKWMFISPYLTEVGDGETEGRIQKTLPEMNFKSPDKCGGKAENLKKLLMAGENIALTHQLLIQADIECAELVKQQKYHMVVDETIDTISNFQSIAQDDIPFLIDNYVVAEKLEKSSKVFKLRWNYEKIGNNYRGDRLEVKHLCDLESLYLFGSKILINKLSPAFINASEQVYILTYMFEPSMMCQWFKMLGIEYEYINVKLKRSLFEIKSRVRDNLIITKTPKKLLDLQKNSLGLYSNSAFSAGWYRRASDDKLDIVKKSCENVVKNHFPRSPKVFWTVFKDYREKVAGMSYARGWEQGVDSFVSKTKRASNEHADANCCLYLVNVYPHVNITNFIDSFEIDLDYDQYALSEMIQFIFRGCIRNGEKMHLMVASERMRNLLIEWLKLPV